MSPPPPLPRSPWRYLRDRDVQHAALVTALALVLSAGLVWLGYLIHVCRVAACSPLAPPRRMVALVFGRRLERDAPEHDYRQRLRRALALAEQQQTGHLLLLGGCSGGRCSEAVAGHAWLRHTACPPGCGWNWNRIRSVRWKTCATLAACCWSRLAMPVSRRWRW